MISSNLNNAIIDTSNHVDTTSNLISSNLNNAILETSNYIANTSNFISTDLINAIKNTSNYVGRKFEFTEGMVVQTKHKTYTKMEIRDGNEWEPINNNIANGFIISIKPADTTSKILVSTTCHIGMEYSSDSRWWGLKLYRKIGTGNWTELSNANGTKTGFGSDSTSGTGCWISHNLGAESSIYSHSITNVSGSYEDEPQTLETVYYTIYWKNRVGELNSGLLFLNRSENMDTTNYPAPSSSLTAVEIWNTGSPYVPLEGSAILLHGDKVGIGIAPTPENIHKVTVNGNINLLNGTYNIDGKDVIQDTSNYIDTASNIISTNLNLAILDTSNHVDTTSNIISTNLNNAIIDTSNYVLQTKFEFSQGMVIQTKHNTYTDMEIRDGNDWEPVNNSISNGFIISIKPSDITSKILVSMTCHIGMEYSTDSRWWGLKLYRKIGNGSWNELSGANGTKTGFGSDSTSGTGCWISHNLGAESSIYSHSITNVSGSYQDEPQTLDTVYYTIYWKNKVGELNSGLLFLNRSENMYNINYPAPSSSWTAVEIWNKGISYEPPSQSNQIQINTEYNSVGINTSPSTNSHKLTVNGNINLLNGTYNINGQNVTQDSSNYTQNTSNTLINKINDLLARIEILENA